MGGITRPIPGPRPAGSISAAQKPRENSLPANFSNPHRFAIADSHAPPDPTDTARPALGGPCCIWRRGWDSNPRYGDPVHLISSQARSTTPAPLPKLFKLYLRILAAAARRSGGITPGILPSAPSGSYSLCSHDQNCSRQFCRTHGTGIPYT